MTDRRRGCKITLREIIDREEQRLREELYQADRVDPLIVNQVRQVIKVIGKQKLLRLIGSLSEDP